MSDLPSDDFTFAMGEYEARFPADRHYITNHMWARCVDDPSSPLSNLFRFGLTAYAVRLLQDVYFLDWIVEPGQRLTMRQHIGSIESKKAESDLYAPSIGTMAQLNESLLTDPSIINASPYEDGWMFALHLDDRSSLLEPDQYREHLDKAWVVAQRTIKGQVNE
jgi:glycine cleavage system H protein